MKAAGESSKMTPTFAGTWQGSIALGNGMELPVVFHFSAEGTQYSGNMDSPAQSAYGMKLDSVTVSGTDRITANIDKLDAAFAGVFQEDSKTISGTWKQHGVSMPLVVHRTEKYQAPNRPQEPKPPFPYRCEDVQIKSGDNTLAGSLNLPEGKGPFPAVILLHGSGPQDRDETILGHKPFLLLADYLTRRGIAVLRYDKRGCGKSSGVYAQSTTKDFAADAENALAFLSAQPDIDRDRIGLLGHSEGGVVAPMVASDSDAVHFIVMLAGSVLPGDEILLGQIGGLSRDQDSEDELTKRLELAKRTIAIVKSEPDNDQAIKKIKAMRKSLNAPEYEAASNAARLEAGANEADQTSQHLDMQLKAITSPWYRFFLSYDPRPALTRVKCPVLALNGDHDIQVLPDPNLQAIEAALRAGGNKQLTTMKLPGLNHLFQQCKTGLPAEYAAIEQTMSPDVLKIIGDWIKKETVSN